MEQIVGQILSQYGLWGLAVAVAIILFYRQGQQNLERNKSVERRFDEDRQRAAEMENRLLDEMQRAIADKDRDITSLKDRFKLSEELSKEREKAHLNLQREFDQFKGQAEAMQQQTLRELDQTKALYEEERRNGISLGVSNNRLTADNQGLIKKNNRLSEDKENLQARVADLEIQLIASKVEIEAINQNTSKGETEPVVMEMEGKS